MVFVSFYDAHCLVKSVVSRTAFVGTVFVLSSFSVQSSADDSLETELRACGAIRDNTVRLTCVDALISKLSGNEPGQQITDTYASNSVRNNETKIDKKIADFGRAKSDLKREKVEKKSIPQQAADFGASPKVDKNGELEEITASISRYSRNSRTGYYTFYLDNGQVWRNTEARGFSIPTKPTSVIISRGAFGSFSLIAINKKGRKGKSGRVKRLK